MNMRDGHPISVCRFDMLIKCAMRKAQTHKIMINRLSDHKRILCLRKILEPLLPT